MAVQRAVLPQAFTKHPNGVWLAFVGLNSRQVTASSEIPKEKSVRPLRHILLREALQALTPDQQKAFIADFGEV